MTRGASLSVWKKKEKDEENLQLARLLLLL
jgi:hypothetical protein